MQTLLSHVEFKVLFTKNIQNLKEIILFK